MQQGKERRTRVMTTVSNGEIVVFNKAKPVDLVEKHAKDLAKLITQQSQGGSEATRSQMRRFYQEYLSLRQKIKSGGRKEYDKNEVAVKMLIAKANYATGRQNVKIPKLFVYWLESNLREIKSAEDVETFGKYFEAFMGYFYAETKGSQGREDAR
jgi:CRISPR type III-A-associated protein Csm2